MFSWLDVQNSDWELSTSELICLTWAEQLQEYLCECKAADGPKKHSMRRWFKDYSEISIIEIVIIGITSTRAAPNNPSIYK